MNMSKIIGKIYATISLVSPDHLYNDYSYNRYQIIQINNRLEV